MKIQRRVVGLLCFALCFWLFAFASHVHASEDLDSHGKSGTECVFCLSLPSGAPAPAVLSIDVAPQSIAVASALPHRQCDGEAPASYLIRGPPAF